MKIRWSDIPYLIKHDYYYRNRFKKFNIIILNHNKIGKNNPTWKGYEELSSVYFSRVKNNAKIRNLEFNITIKQMWDLFLKQNRKCALSGLELKFHKKRKMASDGNASLDRIDSSKGYTNDNIQWIHTDINQMNMEFAEDKFHNYCKVITYYNK